MKQPLLVFLLFFSFLSFSQAQITFQKTYGDSLVEDIGQSILQTADGGYAIAGTRYTAGNIFESLFLIRTNSNGDTLWTKLIRENFNQYQCAAVKQTLDGGFIFTGINGNGNLFNPYLLKTDSAGNVVWSKSYEIAGQEHTYSVVQTTDSGYFIAGYLYNGSNLIYFIKTNSTGDTLWTKSYGETNYNAAVYSAVQTSDGGFIATGTIEDKSTQDVDVCLFKTDALGNVEWTKAFGETGYDYGQQVEQTADGGYAIAAVTYSFGVGSADFYLIKTDSSGSLMWTKTYGGSSDDLSESIHQTFDGGYLFIGESASFSFGNFDVYLIKTNSGGDTLWTKTINGLQNNEGYSLIQTSDSGFAITGTYFNWNIHNDVFLVKTDASGNMGCTERSSNATVTSPATQFINHQLTAFTPGTMVIPTFTNTSTGATVETLCISDGIKENVFENSIFIYPNPAESEFAVGSKQSAIKSIQISNLLGEKIYSAVHCGLQTVACLLFPPGIYFVKIETEEGSVVKKLVKE